MCTLDEGIAKRAGSLLARAKLSFEHAIDAFVVATAVVCSPALIATGDPTALTRHASGLRGLRLFAL